jgi:hypothetical protein
MAKKNEFKEEVMISLVKKKKTRQWLADKMGCSREAFWAKLCLKKNYKPFSDLDKEKIRRLLSTEKIQNSQTK